MSSEGFQSFLRPSEHPHDIDLSLDEREASSSGILQPPATGTGDCSLYPLRSLLKPSDKPRNCAGIKRQMTPLRLAIDSRHCQC